MCSFVFSKVASKGSQAANELRIKNWACGFVYSEHYTVLFHNQEGYYNSLILQASELPPLVRGGNDNECLSG